MKTYMKFTNKWGEYPLTLYYTEGAMKQMLIFSGGFMTWIQLYNWVGQLATKDRAVAVFGVPDVDLKKPEQWSDGFSQVKKLFKPKSTILMGHSMGANGAMIAARELNSFTDCIIAIAPGYPREGQGDPVDNQLLAEAGNYIYCPVGFIVGTEDKITGLDATDKQFDECSFSRNPEKLIISGANHLSFIDPIISALAGLVLSVAKIDNRSTISHRAAINAAINYTIPFIQDNVVIPTIMAGSTIMALRKKKRRLP